MPEGQHVDLELADLFLEIRGAAAAALGQGVDEGAVEFPQGCRPIRAGTPSSYCYRAGMPADTFPCAAGVPTRASVVTLEPNT